MNAQTRDIKELDLNKIVFSKTKHKSKNQFLYVYYDKKPFILKFPKIRLPFGLKKDTISTKYQYILDMSFENHDELLRHVQQFDDYIIEKAHSDIFTDKNIEEVRQMYKSCVKYPNDTRYYPTFRSKIITNDDKSVKCSFYDEQKNKIDVENEGGESYMMIAMQKNSYIESILECIGLWVREDAFGLSFKIIQSKIYPKIDFIEQKDTCDFTDTDGSTSNSDIDFLD